MRRGTWRALVALAMLVLTAVVSVVLTLQGENGLWVFFLFPVALLPFGLRH
ncbi:MAG: hypothetical protein QOD77_685 [Thermoplasmata archaeon]|jgi:hypothetical protein|nr:hypothetical protein [Thermoplasmata archaeon]